MLKTPVVCPLVGAVVAHGTTGWSWRGLGALAWLVQCGVHRLRTTAAAPLHWGNAPKTIAHL